MILIAKTEVLCEKTCPSATLDHHKSHTECRRRKYILCPIRQIGTAVYLHDTRCKWRSKLSTRMEVHNRREPKTYNSVTSVVPACASQVLLFGRRGWGWTRTHFSFLFTTVCVWVRACERGPLYYIENKVVLLFLWSATLI